MKHARTILYAVAAIIVVVAIAAYLGCSNDNGPTAPDVGFTPAAPTTPEPSTSTTNQPAPPDNESEDDESEGPINVAEGSFEIRGNYGICTQSTNFGTDRMSVFRVFDSGNQTRIELYDPPEGTVPCGVLIQIDCTVRDSDPTARPKAYDLYASWGSDGGRVLDCRTPVCVNCGVTECPPTGEPECEEQTWSKDLCKWVGECDQSCVAPPRPGPDCILEANCEWECPPDECDTEELRIGAEEQCSPNDFTVDDDACTFTCCEEDTPQTLNSSFFSQLNGGEEVDECPVCEEEITNVTQFFEGECENRINVTITEFTNTCTGETRQERVETPAPEECPDECILPPEGPIDGVTTGNANTECSSVGNYTGAGKVESGPPWGSGGDFYLVKCGTEYEVQYSAPDGTQCESVEKDISHVSACVCLEE